MRALIGLGLVGAIFVGASYLLTPESEYRASSFRVFDPAHPQHATSDPGFRWEAGAAGSASRIRLADGERVGVFRSEGQAAASLAAHWETKEKTGLFLAPKIGNLTLYRFSYQTGSRSVAMTAYLAPEEGTRSPLAG